MGAGKSAVGRELARRLGRPFHDTDAEVQARTGVDVARIFDHEGEAGFRRRERVALSDLTQRHGIVLATGGGVVADPRNRADLAARGTVIYLRASVAQQLRRTEVSRTRPLLDTADPAVRLERLAREREPLYLGLADLVIETDGRRVPAVAREILERIGGSDKG